MLAKNRQRFKRPPCRLVSGRYVPIDVDQLQSLEVLRLVEVSQLTGHHYRTIYRWIKSGKLPFFKLGPQILVRREDVDAVMTRIAA